MKKPSRSEIASYLIRPMPETLTSRLFRDDRLCRDIEFVPTFAYPVDQSLAVNTESFVSAIRAAANGRKRFKLRAGKAVVGAALAQADDGSVSITIGKRRLLVNDADPLAGTRGIRVKALKRIFDNRSLSAQEEDAWCKLAHERVLTDLEYMEVMTAVGATPEAVDQELGKPKTISVADLVPKERAYYLRLVGKWQNEQSLMDYISGSLNIERRSLLGRHRAVALRRIAFSALLHPLVPFDLLADIKKAELEALLRSANDPFSIAFVFEVARAAALDDPSFLDVGTEALKKLFGNDVEAKARCVAFCAAAVATITRLRLIYDEAAIPLFWFRLAAFAHAGVVTNTFGVLSTADDFLKWINQAVGAEFVWHSIVDLRDAPRWEPDWIGPNQLYAELLGRVWGALQLTPESQRPAEWAAMLQGQIEEILRNNHSNSPFFPGPLEDFVPAANRPREQVFLDVEESLKKARTIDDIRGLVALTYLDRPSPEVADELRRIIEAFRATSVVAEEKDRLFFDSAARVATMVRSIPLANSVINECLRFAATEDVPLKHVIEVLQVALSACAAASNADEHRSMIGETATRFAYATAQRGEGHQQLIAIFDALARRDQKLIASLGRARAIVEAASLRASTAA